MTTLLDELAADTAQRFETRYGRAPRWVAAAPGRVNIIGEHIDYNDGFVLPMALDRYTVIAADEATDNTDGERAAFYSVATNDEAAISLAAPQKHATRGHWSNYVAGVLAGCLGRGMRPGGFQAVIGSDVPVGGGLSSSAALEVATATLIEAMTGTLIDPVAKALFCQRAEHEFAGVPCGIMDQFVSAMGRADHLMLLDCRSREIEHIPMTDPGVTVLVINSNVKHELSGGEYAERRGQCESAARKLDVSSLRDATLDQLQESLAKLEPVEFRRAQHAISEIARTVAAASAVKEADWPRVGELMYASHESLQYDYEVSCAELDLLVELAREIGPERGVIGSRMTGGGFGGCTVSLVKTENVAAVAAEIATTYQKSTGISPTILTSRPSRGAHTIAAS